MKDLLDWVDRKWESWVMDNLDIALCRLVIWRLRTGYGANCETSDLDDYPDMYKKGNLSESIRHGGRCASCQAKEAIDFLTEHIDLIRCGRG